MADNEAAIVTPLERLRLMVVDDDRAILELADGLLRSAGVGSVIKATSCLGALNILADHRKRADCIICDQGMPGMTGLELLRDIRAGRHDFIPRQARFIMLTAHGEEAVVRAAVGLDVCGYIVKPVTKDSLIKAVQRACGKAPLALKLPGDYLEVPLPPGP